MGYKEKYIICKKKYSKYKKKCKIARAQQDNKDKINFLSFWDKVKKIKVFLELNPLSIAIAQKSYNLLKKAEAGGYEHEFGSTLAPNRDYDHKSYQIPVFAGVNIMCHNI